MTLLGMALRGARHYARSGIASALGIAAAAAVITGALVAGGSVTATVRQAAFGRLGRIGYAVVSPRVISPLLARRLVETPGVRAAAPILIYQAAVSNPDNDVIAARVQVLGVPRSFFGLYPRPRPAAPSGRDALVGAALASDLSLERGDGFLLNIARPDALRADSLFARRKPAERSRTSRLTCAAVVGPDGPGGFSLEAEAGVRRTVIVDYEWLAEQMDASGAATAVLVEPAANLTATGLQTAVCRSAEPADLGLQVTNADGRAVIRGTAVTLPAEQLQAVARLGMSIGARAELGSITLATSIGSKEGRAAHYVVTGTSPKVEVPDDGIVLSRWLADDLGAREGSRLSVEWMEPTDDGTYPSRHADLRLKAIIPTERAVAEHWLVPDFAGITDARRISDWDPPFPVDLKLITQRDEEFWDRYQAAPRAFVSEATMRRMWRAEGAAGEWATAARLTSPSGKPDPRLAAALIEAMHTSEALMRSGPAVRDLRAEAETASQGSSDFRGLMLGMSVFIVASALGLAASMMRLSAERRASEIGLMLAVGFRPSLTAVPTIVEGILASAAGSLVGAAAGVPLALVFVRALNSWWSGAVARQTIEAAIAPADIAGGAMSAFALGSLAAAWTGRRLARREALELLPGWRAIQVSGVHSARTRSASARRTAYLPWLVLIAAAIGLSATKAASPETFMAGGAGLLIAGLGMLHAWLKTGAARGEGAPTMPRIAFRNAALHRGHSVLVAGMVAAAAFLLVTVAANVRSPDSHDVRSKRSGAGGFDLVARSTVPLAIGFDTPEGRRNLGFDPADEPLFQGVEIVPLWVSGGVNSGCLNLAKPTEPTIVGATERMVQWNGFSVQSRLSSGEPNPWTVLSELSDPGVVPAFGDAESVRWILHSGLGGTIERTTSRGPVALRFDGLLAFSIFAGEILVSEERFHAMFPEVSAPSMFLIRGLSRNTRALAEALRRNLGDAGIEVRETRDILSDLLAVQNTYLAAFLVLGGLGIVLGTVGLGAVMLRTAAERRSEFALMAALGFVRTAIARMMAQESAALLLSGAVLGTLTALIGSLPRVLSGEASVNWAALGVALASIVVVGLGSCVAAAAAATRGDLQAGLRAE